MPSPLKPAVDDGRDDAAGTLLDHRDRGGLDRCQYAGEVNAQHALPIFDLEFTDVPFAHQRARAG
jgi:hypothetical protein